MPKEEQDLYTKRGTIKMNGNIWGVQIFLVAIICTYSFRSVECLPRTIRVGALFEEENESQELAFRSAIEKINLLSEIIPNSLLIEDVQHVRTHDSFHASRRVCQQIKKGVAAIFGPISTVSAAHVQSICGSLQIPNLHTEWDSRDVNVRSFFAINIYPHYQTMGRAYLDLIRYWGWRKFAVLYEDNDGLVRLQEILKATQDNDFEVTVRKLEMVNGNYISIMKELKNNGEFRIMVDCNTTFVKMILANALELNMTTEYFHYLFTTLDIRYDELKEFTHHGVNISSFRLVDPTKPQVVRVLSDWRLDQSRRGKSPLMGGTEVTTETALMYDAVLLFAAALQELAKAQDVDTSELNCAHSNTWKYGTSLINYMRRVNIEGLTGRIRYDDRGLRTDIDLDILELSKIGFDKIGIWNSLSGINITKNYVLSQRKIAESLANHTLTVVTLLEPPYAMLKEEESGKKTYQGFAIDLLREIALKLKFNYTVYIVKDGTYGAPNDKTGDWNGMVRELIEKNADLAVGGMSITYLREKVIDFTKPFLNVGITILFKKPEKQPPQLFAFLAPLSIEVWVYVVAAYLCVSFMLFVLARFSPYEWYNPHPCNPDSDVVENQFTILNSLWFTVSSLMRQGDCCEFSPRAISTRLVSGTWWFFTLIMISSYTANLAAFLTVERMTSPIERADDLAKQSDIKYGTLYGGSTMTFFKTSKIPIFQRMWHVMDSTDPSVFVNSSQEGIDRVLKGNYAYLGESAIIDYNVQRNCELMQVGGRLDSKGYGIATPRESPYRDLISDAILKLQEEQVITLLYNKWWREGYGAVECPNEDANKDASELGVSTVGGVFVVLGGGLATGLIAALMEFVWKAKKNAEEDKRSICAEMMREFRFAMKCFGSSKKTVKKGPRKKSITDNGIHFMPLAGFSAASGKEAYG
ncbi:glutamate receptor ionotropic, kainate 2-like isoform X2 [Octopus sinensis]|uniref:Glutamate receptor ionotropic, kainate 2-like isoform X2 n=1 Tax=Octopus sinensis TaxID=2607531 RepID=A0A7E6EIW5_9MOLL|nr:glutamate receptor ionotropic, kainate 2-like isoform X2 [Octopus sinensis]